jgi:hypothetical protein
MIPSRFFGAGFNHVIPIINLDTILGARFTFAQYLNVLRTAVLLMSSYV